MRSVRVRIPDVLRPVLAVVCVAAPLLLSAPVAVAHGDDGRLEVVSVVPQGSTAVVTVRLTYGNDGEHVDSATLTVAGDDGTGTRLDPVAMTRTQAPGEYSALVQFPSAGTWNLRVTSVKPAATATVTQEVSADTGVTAPSETTVAGPTTPTVAGPTDSAVAGAAEPSRATTEKEPADDGGGSGALLWIIGAVALLVVVGAGVLIAGRRRSRSQTG